MPVRLLKPYEGQAANTVYWTSTAIENALRGVGVADDRVELASDYERFARIVTAATAGTSRNAVVYRMRSSSPQTLTINTSGYWRTGAVIAVIQEGSGATTIVGASGVAVSGLLTTQGVNTVIKLIKGVGESWIAYASNSAPTIPLGALTFSDGTPLQFSDGSYLELAA